MTLSDISKGNAEAVDFLTRWGAYVHGIDDLIDEVSDNEFKISLFARAIEIYTHPFFLKNIIALRQVALHANNLYADSVACEKSEVKWEKDFADWARHSPTEMVLAVANIAGGYDHMRAVSMEMRKLCYNEHHDDKGNAT
jgi:hypothetical protein